MLISSGRGRFPAMNNQCRSQLAMRAILVVVAATPPAQPAKEGAGRQRRRRSRPQHTQVALPVFTVIQPSQPSKLYVPRGCDPAPPEGSAIEQLHGDPWSYQEPQQQQPEQQQQDKQQDRQQQARSKGRQQKQPKVKQPQHQSSIVPGGEAPATQGSLPKRHKGDAKQAAAPQAAQPGAVPGLQHRQAQGPDAAAVSARKRPQHQLATAAAGTSAVVGASPAARAAVPADFPADNTSTADKPRPAWAIAVDRRIASLPSNTRAARNMRWQRPQRAAALPASMFAARQGTSSSRGGSSSTSRSSGRAAAGQQQGAGGSPLLLATASIEEFLENGELSVAGEQQLCLAYQRFVQLQQLTAQPQEFERLMQQQQQQQQRHQAAAPGLPDDRQEDDPAAGLADVLLQNPAAVQSEGLLSQELLLQLYEPLLMRQVRRVRSPVADERELLAAARQGLLHAAARFDAARACSGNGGEGSRLYALALHYIRNALRNVVAEYQTAVVHVPTYVRETAARLNRVKQQLQQGRPGVEVTLAEVADAAGVGLQQAERALAATSGALNAMSLQGSVDKDKEDRGKAGSGMDLQQVDVSMEEDSQELSGVVGAGGLAAARSGLEQELDAAAQQAAVDALVQSFMAKLRPQDRDLLALKLEGGNISEAARDLGKSKEWGRKMVGKVVAKLRDEVRQHAEQDAELAALLSR